MPPPAILACARPAVPCRAHSGTHALHDTAWHARHTARRPRPLRSQLGAGWLTLSGQALGRCTCVCSRADHLHLGPFPQARLVTFCLNATKEWFTILIVFFLSIQLKEHNLELDVLWRRVQLRT